MPNSQVSDWLSTSEAAEYIGVSVSTLYRYEADGHIESVRTPGGHRRFRRVQLDALMPQKAS